MGIEKDEGITYIIKTTSLFFARQLCNVILENELDEKTARDILKDIEDRKREATEKRKEAVRLFNAAELSYKHASDDIERKLEEIKKRLDGGWEKQGARKKIE